MDRRAARPFVNGVAGAEIELIISSRALTFGRSAAHPSEEVRDGVVERACSMAPSLWSAI